MLKGLGTTPPTFPWKEQRQRPEGESLPQGGEAEAADQLGPLGPERSPCPVLPPSPGQSRRPTGDRAPQVRPPPPHQYSLDQRETRRCCCCTSEVRPVSQ